MAPGSRAPFPCPPRANRRTRASRGEFAGSCSWRLCRRVTILPFGLRLLLLAPAAEFCVSPNHHLQRGVDDVIRGALDEGRIFLYCKCDWLLQFVFALHHLRWLVNDGHWSSPLLSFSSWPYWTRARYTGNGAFPGSLGWSDRHGFRGNGVGSLQPSPVFCPRPKSTLAPGATSVLSITSVHRRGERNGEPTGEPRVSCAVHPFSDSFVKRASPIPHKIGLKEHCSFRSQLRKLQSQFALRNPSCDPCAVEVLETLAMEAPSCVIQKLEVRCHRHDVFMVFPLPANFEVMKDFGRYVGFERLLDVRAEALFRAAKLRGSGRNIEQAKAFQVAEEALVGREMRYKTPKASRPRIHITESDHRREAGDGSCEKEGKLIHEITDS